MAFWKQKYNRTDGFSLIEVIVAITILGFIAVPMLSGLLKSYQLNLRSDERMQAQLAVSSAVETIMAEGFKKENNDYEERFPDVLISDVELDSSTAYRFTVTARDMSPTAEEDALFSDISVTTYARQYVSSSEGGDDNE